MVGWEKFLALSWPRTSPMSAFDPKRNETAACSTVAEPALRLSDFAANIAKWLELLALACTGSRLIVTLLLAGKSG
jgi:hypothetical protein